MISYPLPINKLPRAVRLSYAYRPAAAEFKSSFYAEVGCNILFGKSDAFLVYFNGDTGVQLVAAYRPLLNLFGNPVWHRVSQELLFDASAGPGATGVTFDTTVSEVDGGSTIGSPRGLMEAPQRDRALGLPKSQANVMREAGGRC